MIDLSIDQLVKIIRDNQGIGENEQLRSDSQLERDLGITGDDGEELLEAIGKRFGITFTRQSFGLGENEYLFGPEASFDFGLGALVRILRRRPPPKYRILTVGELYEVVRKELESQGRQRDEPPGMMGDC
jgi:hypothetical protein